MNTDKVLNNHTALFTSGKPRIICGVSFGSNKIEIHHKDLTKPVEELKFVVAYTGPHARWARMIQMQLASALESALPSINFTIELLLLTGDVNDVTQTLLNHKLLSGQAEAGHSFIVTPGWWESEVVHEARLIGAISVPQLFCVPGSPATLFEAGSGTVNDRRNFGGVYSWPTSPSHYVNNLRAIKPNMKKVCIAYSAHVEHGYMSRSMKYQAAALRNAFAEEGIMLVPHFWDHTNMGLLELTEKARKCDAVVTLHEPNAEMYHREVIDMCNFLKIPYCASELDSVHAGAVIGCGVTGGSFSAPLVSLVAEYLLNPSRGLNWETICIPEQPGAHLNELACEAQGITLNKEQEALFKMRSIHAPAEVKYS